MAYMNQEKKKALAPGVKKVLTKWGLKGSLSVQNHSTLVLTINSGSIDFLGRNSVNHYHINRHWEGDARDALLELRDAMMKGNHDRSDIQTDYFDVGWYIDINIGKWNKPYVCTARATA